MTHTNILLLLTKNSKFHEGRNFSNYFATKSTLHETVLYIWARVTTAKNEKLALFITSLYTPPEAI